MKSLAIVQMLEKTSFSTGSVVQMFEAARALAARGHRVTVVTRRSKEMASRCAEAGVAHVALALRNEFDVLSMRRFAHLARHGGVGIVHVHKGIAHSVALGATYLGAHYGLVVNRGVSFPLGFFASLKYRSDRVDRIVAVCDFIRNALARSGRVPAAKIQTVYAGVDTDRFDPARVNPTRVREELGIAGSARVVGLVGIRDWKGWKELLQAFPAVRAAVPDAHLLFVGCSSEKQRSGVLHLAAEMALGDTVTATLTRTDMPDVLAASDVVVDASWAGTGITGTIREAMALEKPVVATAVAGNPELVEDGISGLRVPPRDTPTLAAAIVRLLTDLAFAATLAANARERVRQKFSTWIRVRRLEALYQQILNERSVV